MWSIASLILCFVAFDLSEWGQHDVYGFLKKKVAFLCSFLGVLHALKLERCEEDWHCLWHKDESRSVPYAIFVLSVLKCFEPRVFVF